MEQPDNLSPASGQPEGVPPVQPARSLFADDAAPYPPPPPDQQPLPNAPRRKSNYWTRIVLPIGLLLAGVAVLAWVSQQVPGRVRKITGGNEPAATAKDVLGWPITEAYWGEKDYRGEYEVNTGGHYDFEFYNLLDEPVEFGVAETTCVCTKVEAGLFKDAASRTAFTKAREAGNPAPPVSQVDWVKMDVDKEMRKSMQVPAKAAGIVRVYWDGKKAEPELLSLRVKIWSRAPAQGHERALTDLRVTVAYVRPAMFDVLDKIELGGIDAGGKATASFKCWSATRQLKVEPNSEDKRITVTVRELTGEELPKFAQYLREKGVPSKPKCAFQIEVTVHEASDGKQLDMGLLLRPVPVKIMHEGKQVAMIVPWIRALVRGDVTLSASEEGGRIDFKNFLAKDGRTKKVKLYAPPDAKLTFVGCEPVLLDLEAAIKPGKMVGNQREWDLDVTVRPNRDPGPLPEDGVLVLRCVLTPTGASQPVTRLVSIPVVGSATRH